MTIHEEASQAYREALADGCACWRCQDAGLRAVLAMVGRRVHVALEMDGIRPPSDSHGNRLLHEMRWPSCEP